MGIQIPPDATYSVQKALRELDEKIDYLVSTMARGVSPSDLSQAYNTLSQRIEETYRKPTTLDFNDVFRGGGAHALGYVPDPGPGPPDSEHVLTSTGAWGPVLNGYVRVATPGAGGRSLAQAVVEVHGSLAVLSALSACSVRTRTLDVFGNADIKGMLSAVDVAYIIRRTDDAAGPYIAMQKRSASPAAYDSLGTIEFDGYNDAAEFLAFAYLRGLSLDVTDGVENGAFNFWIMNKGIAVAELQIVPGQVYITSDCSALTFTDRTPYPVNKSEAYSAIGSIEGDSSGNLKHDTLHTFVKSVSVKDGKTVNSRNLSATVSALTEVVKDLITRIAALEKKP